MLDMYLTSKHCENKETKTLVLIDEVRTCPERFDLGLLSFNIVHPNPLCIVDLVDNKEGNTGPSPNTASFQDTVDKIQSTPC